MLKTAPMVYALAFMGALLVGVFDFWTGWQISFSVFYLLPILYGTWYGSRTLGYIVSIMSAAIWLLSDFLTAPLYSHDLIPYWNAAVRLSFFVLLAYLLGRLRARLELERKMARTDPLTELYNSRAFYESAETEVSRSRRYGRPLSVAYLDLDNFKKVNDTSGHEEGDRLLQIVASTIVRNVRGSDLVSRLGGDEFAVLFPETNIEQAKNAIEKLQGHLAKEMQTESWPVTFSFGVVIFDGFYPKSAHEMVKVADALMYSAKRSGKARSLFKPFERLRSEVVDWRSVEFS